MRLPTLQDNGKGRRADARRPFFAWDPALLFRESFDARMGGAYVPFAQAVLFCQIPGVHVLDLLWRQCVDCHAQRLQLHAGDAIVDFGGDVVDLLLQLSGVLQQVFGG